MTRWARAGNSQRHKKQPEDPTPWEEFVKQRKIKKSSETKDHDLQSTATETESITTKSIDGNIKIKKHKKKNKHIKDEDSNTISFSEEQLSKSVKGTFTLTKNDNSNHIKKNKKHKKKHLRNISTDDIQVLPNTCIGFPKEEKLMHAEKKQKSYGVVNNSKDVFSNALNSHTADSEFVLSSPAKTSLRGVEHEKIKFMDRLKQKRLENEILLLPPKVERKIYNMKKELRFKGVPGENIKEITSKIRRKEELKFRKTSRPCFKCRKIGHMFSDCPLLKSSCEEGTGICFKCGSSEHTSFRCSIKTSEYPFATCFICNERGHISRACPKNEHGVFPKGGCCNICGNVNHLKKDCPTLRKQVKEEEEMTLGTFTGNENVEEVDDNKLATFIPKKPKIISF